MYVIQIDEYFDKGETPYNSTVEGYFTTKENAHDYLVEKGFKHIEHIENWFDGESVIYEFYELISENEMRDFQAKIIELKLIR